MIRKKVRRRVRLGNFGLVLATLTGFGVLVLLLVCNDAPAIFSLLASIGWGLLSIVLVRAGIIVMAGLGWAKLVEPFASVPLHVYLNLRWIREAINVLLPVAQVGGDLIGGRLLSFRGVPGGLAGASILVDLLIQIIAQFTFTLFGFAALVRFGADARISGFAASGLAVSAVALLGFYVVQRSSILRIAEDAFTRFMQRWSPLTFNPVALHAKAAPPTTSTALIVHSASGSLGVGRRGNMDRAAVHGAGRGMGQMPGSGKSWTGRSQRRFRRPWRDGGPGSGISDIGRFLRDPISDLPGVVAGEACARPDPRPARTDALVLSGKAAGRRIKFPKRLDTA